VIGRLFRRDFFSAAFAVAEATADNCVDEFWDQWLSINLVEERRRFELLGRCRPSVFKTDCARTHWAALNLNEHPESSQDIMFHPINACQNACRSKYSLGLRSCLGSSESTTVRTSKSERGRHFRLCAAQLRSQSMSDEMLHKNDSQFYGLLEKVWTLLGIAEYYWTCLGFAGQSKKEFLGFAPELAK
jgi:hypothetical protein